VKAFAAQLCLFLTLAVIPAFGNSIPTSFTGVGCDGSLSSTFLCFASSTKTGLDTFFVANSPNTGDVIYIPDGYSSLRGGISGLVFNSSLGTLKGTFSGDEFLVGAFHGIYEYAVSGTFFVTWNGNGFTGTAGIDITSSTFIGRVGTTPEPGTLAMMGTGLCGILTVVRRKLRRG
jgi:hypothetical protein